MPIEHKLEHCEPGDPDQCQSQGANGQCLYRHAPDSKYCPRHAQASERCAEKKLLNQYRLQIWQQRMEEFSESPDVKSLRCEIGILRILLENKMTQCQTPQQLLLHSQSIADMLVKMEKLVSSCDRLESRMGMMLDKSAALTLAGQIVEIITSHIDNPEVVDKISNEIITALAKIK